MKNNSLLKQKIRCGDCQGTGYIVCARCVGCGFLSNLEPCPTCKGKGLIEHNICDAEGWRTLVWQFTNPLSTWGL